MTKQQRLLSLERRIGQLEAHGKLRCSLLVLFCEDIKNMGGEELDRAIAERLKWLRENNEKERMGRGRY